MAQSALFVLGMHRSGTSPQTGMLDLLGARLGHRLIPPRTDVNEKGFWENADILDLHERLLADMGFRWDDLAPFPENWLTDPIVTPYVWELGQLVEREFHGAPLWAVKDPRLCHLLPVWDRLLDRQQTNRSAVIMVRHPSEVSASLKRRDAMAEGYAKLLWVRHLLAAEINTRHWPRVFVTFEQLLDNWRSCRDRIGEMLEIEWPRSNTETEQAIDELLDRRLRHHRTIAEQGGIDGWIADMYEALVDASNGNTSDLGRRLAPAQDISASIAAALGPDIKQNRLHLEQTGQALDQALSSIAALADADSAHQSTIARLTAELVASRSQVAPGGQTDDGPAPPHTASTADTVNSRPATPSTQKEYEGVIDMSVENNSHTKMLRMIQACSAGRRQRVLDIGCSSGYFGEALRALGHEVWGVEPNPGTASQAAKRMDKVFEGGVDEFLDSTAAAETRFDCITFGDVLEHVADPEQVLRRCSEILSPRGRIATSIPNVTHRAVRAMLVGGAWRYGDYGILDNTHLRFFDRSGIVELISNSGFSIEEFDTVKLEAEQTGIPFDSKTLEQIGPLIVDHDADVFQYVLIARKGNTADNARFTSDQSPHALVLSQNPNSSETAQRFIEPIRLLNRVKGGDIQAIAYEAITDADVERSTIAIIDNIVTAEIIGLVKQLKGAGKTIVLDLASSISPPPASPEKPQRLDLIGPVLDDLLKHVDVVTTPSGRVAQELQRRAPTSEISNPQPELAAVNYDNETRERTLIFCTDQPVSSAFVEPALKRFTENSSSPCRIVAIGPIGKELSDNGVEVQRHEPMKAHGLIAFLATLTNPIGLFPGADSDYEADASFRYLPIFAAAGISCVCSSIPPYSTLLRSGESALLCNNTESSWIDALQSLTTNPNLLCTLGSNARRVISRERSLSRSASQWGEVLLSPNARTTPTPTGEEHRLRKILCLLPLVSWTIGDIRIVDPLRHWSRIYGGETRVYSVYDYPPDELAWADVLILQRESDPKTLNTINTAHALGKRVIFDIDDLLTDVPTFLSVHQHTKEIYPYLAAALGSVDAISVTTDRLRQGLTQFNPSIFLIPNCLDGVSEPIEHSDNHPITLLVASSDTVRVDFVAPTLKRLQESEEIDVRIVAIGPPADFLEQSGLQIEKHGLMDRRQFRSFLSGLSNAIGVIPLDASQFSSCKSAIKFVDFSLTGIPCVCSAVPPYSDVIEAGITGVLCPNTMEAWSKSLLTLCRSAGLRSIIAANARGLCERRFSLDDAADAWQFLFRELDSRPVKTARAVPRKASSVGQQLLLLTYPEIARNLVRVLKSEGARGISVRISRRLSRMKQPNANK